MKEYKGKKKKKHTTYLFKSFTSSIFNFKIDIYLSNYLIAVWLNILNYDLLKRARAKK
jgi:hypothetical protein